MSKASKFPPEIVSQVRKALAHLYDYAYLQNHPLAALVDPGSDLDRVTRGQRLRRLLLDCIALLRPQEDTDAASDAARAHSMLTYRYIDGVPMNKIAAMRALGSRQAYREVGKGVEAVARILQDKLEAAGAQASVPPSPQAEPEADSRQAVQAEVARLQDTLRIETVNLRDVLQSVLDLLRPICAHSGVSIRIISPEPWPPVRADRVMLRQGLLNLLMHGIDTAAGGGLLIEAYATPAELRLTITESPGSSRTRPPTLSIESNARVNLQAGHALLTAQGGRLDIRREQGRWQAQVVLPTLGQPTILVVDDNRDMVALLQRYVVGHRLLVVGATDGEQALRLAEQIQPRLITLDVMMPDLDGWEILQRLKANPAMAHVPVIICSVLPAEQLASSMGASGYVGKPVKQEDLLRVLRRWLGPLLPAD